MANNALVRKGRDAKKRLSAEVWSNSALVRSEGGLTDLPYASSSIVRSF